MPEGRHDTGPVPVTQVDGAGQPALTAAGPLKTGGNRLDDLLGDLDAALGEVDATGQDAQPYTKAQLQEMGLEPPMPHPRGINGRGRAAPRAGSIVERMTVATWGNESADGEVD